MTKDNHEIIAGIHLLASDMPELNGFLANCPNASAAIATTEGWAKYWKSQGTMKIYSQGYHNLMQNKATLMTDVGLLEDDYDAQNYYGTAVEAAAIA
jgi:hypothetical protein